MKYLSIPRNSSIFNFCLFTRLGVTKNTCQQLNPSFLYFVEIYAHSFHHKLSIHKGLSSDNTDLQQIYFFSLLIAHSYKKFPVEKSYNVVSSVRYFVHKKVDILPFNYLKPYIMSHILHLFCFCTFHLVFLEALAMENIIE